MPNDGQDKPIYFSAGEYDIISTEAEKLDMSPGRWARLAIAHYQSHIARLAVGETCTYSKDSLRTQEYIGLPSDEQVVCFACGVIHTDRMEIQEFLRWKDTGGYGNKAFGDGAELKLDLCQYCVKLHLGKFVQVIEG